jgi:hypothetical protein
LEFVHVSYDRTIYLDHQLRRLWHGMIDMILWIFRISKLWNFIDQIRIYIFFFFIR